MLRSHRTVLKIIPLLAALIAVSGAHWAHAIDRCARADQRLATRGAGDRDFDGLSNCTERLVLGTSHKDPDSDDDGIDDGDEVTLGTDPLDPDSDDDGRTDGEEEDLGTDPTDADTDDDGIDDGEDLDPANELESKIEGSVDAISCGPSAAIVVLGIEIAIAPDARYEDVDSCVDLAARIDANGGGHVEVAVLGNLQSGFVAREVQLEDADNDGSPDNVDDDDDNDGTDDDDEDDHEDEDSGDDDD